MLIRRVPPRAWALLAIALVLRLAVVGATFDTPTTFDPADFSHNGWSIAQGHGIPPSNRAPAAGPSAFRPPAFPLFLGAVYASVGREAPAIARLAEALLGTLAVPESQARVDPTRTMVAIGSSLWTLVAPRASEAASPARRAGTTPRAR